MTKDALRKAFLQKRKNADEHSLIEKNALIAQKLESYVGQNSFKTLHTFLPRLNSREIDTFLIIESLRLAFPEMRIAAPYMVPGTREMEHFLVTPSTHLVVNPWKIPEPDPVSSEKIHPEEIDIVLVPLLAFDNRGYRVGYGGGYYDRFLAQCKDNVVKIGLSFFGPVAGIEDLNEHDIPLNACITPENTFQFRTE